MRYCTRCAAPLKREIPPGDDRARDVCDACGTIHYRNPRMVVGSIPAWGDRILMCRRAIEPRRGFWTLPAGYLENGESVQDGARRETREEAGATVADLQPYALYNLTFVNQVYLMFRARLAEKRYRPGPESLEVRLFGEAEIPWDDLAFTVIRATLERYLPDRKNGDFPFLIGDIDAPAHPLSGAAGPGPTDPGC